MTRRWRRKPLKSLKTDSEMAPAGLAIAGKKKLRKSALKPLKSLNRVNLCADGPGLTGETVTP
jgi:hypothetical protein